MAPDTPDAALALAQRIAAALTDPSDKAELLGRLARTLARRGRTGEAQRALADARALAGPGIGLAATLALAQAQAALGDNAGARAALNARRAKVAATRDRPQVGAPVGDLLRQRRPLAEERRLLSGTNFAPDRDSDLEAIATAQAQILDVDGVWKTLSATSDVFAQRTPLTELVRALHRAGRTADARATIEKARPIFGTRDFDRGEIAALQASIGDEVGALTTVQAMTTAEKSAYRLRTLLVLAEGRLARRDISGAAEAAEVVANGAPGLSKAAAGISDPAWLRRGLGLKAAALLYRAGRRDRARLLWQQLGPADRGEMLALAQEMASLGALEDAQALWSALEPALRLPVALARARFAGASPIDAVAAARTDCGGDVRKLQNLALVCAEAGFFVEAEKTAQPIADTVERLETLRRIALLAVEKALPESA